MNTIKEQIENKCKHFTGMLNKKCAVGVKYEDIKNKSSRPFKLPCLKDGDFGGGICTKASWKTPEEVETEVKEIEEMGNRQITAYAAVI